MRPGKGYPDVIVQWVQAIRSPAPRWGGGRCENSKPKTATVPPLPMVPPLRHVLSMTPPHGPATFLVHASRSVDKPLTASHPCAVGGLFLS